MILLLTNMKLISLILIRTSQGILISAGIITLFLFVILFVWAYFLSIGLHRLRDLSHTKITQIGHLDVHDLMQPAYKKFSAINLFSGAAQTPNKFQINKH